MCSSDSHFVDRKTCPERWCRLSEVTWLAKIKFKLRAHPSRQRLTLLIKFQHDARQKKCCKEQTSGKKLRTGWGSWGSWTCGVWPIAGTWYWLQGGCACGGSLEEQGGWGQGVERETSMTEEDWQRGEGRGMATSRRNGNPGKAETPEGDLQGALLLDMLCNRHPLGPIKPSVKSRVFCQCLQKCIQVCFGDSTAWDWSWGGQSPRSSSTLRSTPTLLPQAPQHVPALGPRAVPESSKAAASMCLTLGPQRKQLFTGGNHARCRSLARSWQR